VESLHYLLMKTHAMFSRKILSQVGKIGLTSGQPKILDFLLQYQEADQKTIASYCEIEPATVGSILLRMEDAGLVVRRQKNGNRRSLFVSLTEKGQQAAAKLTDIFYGVECEATENLSDREVTELKELLGKMCKTLQTESENRKV
jgi:DNA-binding MarR family transcriptional regulator